MNAQRILIAGIGNIFLGDDAFGVEVAKLLAQRPWPAQVRVVDFGIRGLDLAYALLDGYKALILVDACPRGGVPGTLYALELEQRGAEVAEQEFPMHNVDPVAVLRLAWVLGARVEQIFLVGCEPEPPHEDGMSMQMSQRVQAALEGAVEIVQTLVERLLPTREIQALACCK